MARELKIDVIVDDHGAVQTLQNVARAEDQVTAAAKPMAQGLDTVYVSTTEADRALSDMHVSAQQLPITFSTVRGAVNELAEGFGITVEKLGAFGSAGLVVGTAMGAWQIGRHIADWGGLDKKIADTAATLLGWGNVSAEEAAAKADVLARASKSAGIEITDLNLAMQINADVAAGNIEKWRLFASGIDKGRVAVESMRDSTAAYIREGAKQFDDYLAKMKAKARVDEADTARWKEKVHELENGGMHAYTSLHQWYGELQRDQKYINELVDQNIQKFIAAQQAAGDFTAKALADAQALDAALAANPIGTGPPHLDVNGQWVDGNGRPMPMGGRLIGGSLIGSATTSDDVAIMNHSIIGIGGQNANTTVGSGQVILQVDARGAMLSDDRALDTLADKMAARLGSRAAQLGAVR